MKKNRSFRIWGFLAVVYLSSVILWTPILISGRGMATMQNTILMALITFVPSVTGILFTYIIHDREGRRDFWRRIFHWPSAPLPVLLLALAILPLLNILSYVLSFILVGQSISFDYARDILSNLPLLLQFLFVEITFGALSEELGWRGYLLDELQSRWSALSSSVILGFFWGLWHTPAFFVPGLSQHEMGGILSLPYLSFIITPIMSSVIQTWAYNNTGRSTLVAGIMMHFLTNASLIFMSGIFDKFSMPSGFWIVSMSLYTISAVIIVVVWGPRTLTHPTDRNDRKEANLAHRIMENG